MDRLLICIAFCFGLGYSGFSQNEYTLEPVFPSDNENFSFIKDIPLIWSDSTSVELALKQLVFRFRENGYLLASADNSSWKENKLVADIDPGPQVQWAKIEMDSDDLIFLEGENINLNRWNGKEVFPGEFTELENKILNAAINRGYPFAKIYLDDLEFEDEGLKGTLVLEKGKAFNFGKVRNIDPVNISNRYLQQYLGIEEGEPYSKEVLEKIPVRLRELPFVESKKDPTVTFLGSKAIVNLFLKDKKASRGDAILGYLPRNNSLNPEESQKDLFTLSLMADLNNQLGVGERIYVKFEQLRPQRQELELKGNYPYIFGLPFGANGEFSLYRRDSAFIGIISELGVQYLFSGNNFLKVYWENRTTNLADIDTSKILQQRSLPDQLDTRNTLFGIEWNQQNLNYRFNPRSGWEVKLRTGFGLKKVRENNKILDLAREDFSPQIIYDSLAEQSWQIRVEGQIAKYVPVGVASTIKGSLRLGSILAESDVFRNEQFRLGGNQLLRGFDEENFNATHYGVATLEYRLLLATNSALFAFGDFGFVEDISSQTDNRDFPVGLGAGITFETKVGIFGFSLAVGKEEELGFDLRRVKTHFGYVSLF
ncbi:MAG: BamA/TamA family outer membrane protein [Saprospiraceae bacterium]|nr:BamA/TamA family outer membrane protein [Saprospiraceae bacterium]